MPAWNLDLNEMLSDARLGLSAWFTAVRELRDNPVYRFLNRPARAVSPLSRLLRYLAWAPPVLALFGLGTVIYRLVTAASPDVIYDRQVMIILAAALLVYTLWITSNLFQLSRDALLLLADRNSLGRSDIHFDEAVMAVRLADREFITAMLASLLPRIFVRWLTTPVIALAGVLILQLWIDKAETLSELSYNPNVYLSLLSAENIEQSLALISGHAPVSIVLLALAMVLPALIMLLWLIALGRNLPQRWMVHLVALCVTVGQVLWIPVGFAQVLNWRMMNTGGVTLSAFASAVLIPIITLAVFVASLHFSKRIPWVRLLLSAATPVLCLSFPFAAVWVTGMRPLSSFVVQYDIAHTATWILSAFAMLNPFFLFNASSLGISETLVSSHRAFEWFRVPVVLALQLVCLAISAHAARLAFADWRKSEV